MASLSPHLLFCVICFVMMSMNMVSGSAVRMFKKSPQPRDHRHHHTQQHTLGSEELLSISSEQSPLLSESSLLGNQDKFYAPAILDTSPLVLSQDDVQVPVSLDYSPSSVESSDKGSSSSVNAVDSASNDFNTELMMNRFLTSLRYCICLIKQDLLTVVDIHQTCQFLSFVTYSLPWLKFLSIMPRTQHLMIFPCPVSSASPSLQVHDVHFVLHQECTP